jgi:uncharacterized protein (TIGR02391 family)
LPTSPAEIVEMPLDVLAIAVLGDFDGEWSIHNWQLEFSRRLGDGSGGAMSAVAEAIGWLRANGLLADQPPSSSGGEFVTRFGRRVLDEGPAVVHATRRLDVDLDHRLQRARSQFLVGDYELAAFAAMKEVEVAARGYGDADKSLLGTSLMQHVFKPAAEGSKDTPPGKLANPALDGGEQRAIRDLFAGAIGAFKNPASHRVVDVDDPTEASEVIFLADLLLRMLERERRRTEGDLRATDPG